MTLTLGRILRKAIRANGDIYHLHDPELIPVGLVLRAMGRRVIYDAHESLPEQVFNKRWIASSLRPIVARGARLLERAADAAFDAVVAATPHIAEAYSPSKTVVVQNFPRAHEFEGIGGPQYRDRCRVAIYIGGLSFVRGAREMVDAAELVAADDIFRIVFAGRFEDGEVEARCREATGWKHVDYRGWLDRREVSRLLAEARIGLALFLPAPNHSESFPTKLFEYMAAGLPVVASHFELWREIIEGNRCGVLADPRDPADIARGIRQLLNSPGEAEKMGQRGRAAVMKNFTWETQAVELVRLYRDILRQGLGQRH